MNENLPSTCCFSHIILGFKILIPQLNIMDCFCAKCCGPQVELVVFFLLFMPDCTGLKLLHASSFSSLWKWKIAVHMLISRGQREFHFWLFREKDVIRSWRTAISLLSKCLNNEPRIKLEGNPSHHRLSLEDMGDGRRPIHISHMNRLCHGSQVDKYLLNA